MTDQLEQEHPPERLAPGAPGSSPTWSPAAKSGVGGALSTDSRLWFTLSRGIVTEVYHRWLDQAAIRDLEMVVTAPGGFFSEEKHDCVTDTRLLGAGVPAYELINTCAQGRYRITKQIVADPVRDVLLQRVEVTPLIGTLADLRLFVLLSSRLGDQGADNNGWVGAYRRWQLLFAQHEEHSLALASSVGWRGCSVGYVGASDIWQDLRQHGRMTWHYDRADHGHIALGGEIDLQKCGGKFMLALAFDRAPHGAAVNAALSLNDCFDDALKTYVGQWQTWQRGLACLDDGQWGPIATAGAQQRRRPDHSRPHPTPDPRSEPGNLYRTSMMVLRVHRAKQFDGAAVASLTIPWGEARGDKDLGGYHLVWPRDLVEEAFGMLAGGAMADALAVLNYLRVTQKVDGGWPQDMWLDGSAYASGVQLDEAALPILLLDLAHRESAVTAAQVRSFWPMVRSAAAFIIKSGPASQEDRWENTPGLTPFTLATEIAALLVAARLAEQFDERQVGEYFRQTADLWNDSIERWTYVTNTPLASQVGVEGYYVRIAPSPGMHALRDRGETPTEKQAHGLPVTRVVSPDALALVRFGLRSAADPRIVNTLKVIDAMTRVELPAGPCWHRYDGDYYGESVDGAPFHGESSEGKKTGRGRCWPLLTGERGHYELQAGRTDAARHLLAVMGGFASQVGLLPEQVWDADDLPQRYLYHGRPSGSAMPLAWTHSEYIRLLRSIRDGRVFDLPPDAAERYANRNTGSDLDLWRFDHQSPALLAGRRLRIEVLAPAIVHFSTDGWQHGQEMPTRDTGLGFHTADLPTADMTAGDVLIFTFRWPNAGNRWEGRDFQLTVEAPRRALDGRASTARPRSPARAKHSGAISK